MEEGGATITKRSLAPRVNVESIIVLSMMVAVISIPLVKTVVGIASMQALGASVCIAGSSIRMIGMTSKTQASISRPFAMGVDVKSIVVLSRMIAVMVSTINSHTSRTSIAVMVAGISIPLVKTMMGIASVQTLGASVCVARSSIGMIGKTSETIAGISRPLVKTMVAIASMKTLNASVCVAGSSIRMIGMTT